VRFFDSIDFRFRPPKINVIIRNFILADLALLAGWGLIEPVFAIFIVQRIEGATVVTVGIAAAIYWLVKSAVQVPVAVALDKNPSERDDYFVLISGLVLAGLTAFSFALIDQIWQLYLVKVIHAAAFALYIPSWYSLFANHLDKGHRSLEFSLDSTAIGIAAGVTGLLGSLLVKWFGFVVIFVIAAIMCFIAAAMIFYSPELVFPHRRYHRGQEMAILGDHTPKNINK